LALKAFDKALRLDPKRISTLRNKGIALLRMHSYKEALTVFD
jgi:hypothetical protein